FGLLGRVISAATFLAQSGFECRRPPLSTCRRSAPLLMPSPTKEIAGFLRMTDMVGQRFGRLRVLARDGVDCDRRITWRCVCDCGKEAVVCGRNLRSRNTRSCGCFRLELIHRHGMWKTPEYKAWEDMRRRCANPSSGNYVRYG